ncbi:MAG: response regulator [Anaerolineaceae bacterium]|nr:response regulator [Anaerolineaceae bacterium]
MTNSTPVKINQADWSQTPPAIKSLVNESIKRIEQLEAQLKNSHATVDPNAEQTLADDLLAGDKEPLVGHLLVVDDNEMNRDMLSRRLKRQGHMVDVAVNGRDALTMMKQQPFDLVLLDIMMPEMNGYEALERMKADKDLSFIPVIMISAVDEIESIVHCIKLGAEDYLSKPFNNTMLKARIGASLEKKRLRDRQAAYIRQLNIENQRKSIELENARRIQLSLLPSSPPMLPYLDIAAYQETASEVGGDYYDFSVKTDGKLLITIGDATGHGVASGLLVSMTKASLLATSETDLITLTQKINHILNEIDLGVQLNMALMLVELIQTQPGQVTVRACGGGMPPIYLLRTNGDLEEFIISGLPLAVTKEAHYKVSEFTLTSGDTMLLMTDGLSEMFNADREFLSFDRLITGLASLDLQGLTAAEVIDQVARIGHDWAKGHPIADDVTIVAVRVK